MATAEAAASTATLLSRTSDKNQNTDEGNGDQEEEEEEVEGGDWGSDFDDEYEQYGDLAQETHELAQRNNSMIEQHYNCSVNGSVSSGFSSGSGGNHSGNLSGSGGSSTDNKDEQCRFSLNSSSGNSSLGTGSGSCSNEDLYEIPDGKPAEPTPTAVHVLPAVPDDLQGSPNTIGPKPPRPKPPAKPKKASSSVSPESFQNQNHLLHMQLQRSVSSPAEASNFTRAQPSPPHLVEQVLLPTRAKEDDSKKFIDKLRRKLSQKNLHLKLNKSTSQGQGEDPGRGYKKSGGNESGGSSLSWSTIRSKVKQRASILGSIVNSTTETTTAPTSATSTPTTTSTVPVVSRPKSDLECHSGQSQTSSTEDVQKFPWFYRIDRQKAELILENYTTDGSFLVRECQHGGGPAIPFTLTIRFATRFFHIQIRLRPEDGRFALGTTKTNEMHFGSVQELIDTYRKTPLQLHTNGIYFGETKLNHPPIVYSFSK